MLRLVGLAWLSQAFGTLGSLGSLGASSIRVGGRLPTGAPGTTRARPRLGAARDDVCCVSVCLCFVWEDSSWGQLCVGHFQSPIDIEPKHADKGALLGRDFGPRSCASLGMKGDFEIRMLYSPLRLQET